MTTVPARRETAVGEITTLLGRGSTEVAGGKSSPIKLKLNRRGLAMLRERGKLVGTVTVVAANGAGETQTKTSRVTIEPAKPAKHP